jgi:hypothetical protein
MVRQKESCTTLWTEYLCLPQIPSVNYKSGRYWQLQLAVSHHGRRTLFTTFYSLVNVRGVLLCAASCLDFFALTQQDILVICQGKKVKGD